VCVNPRSTHTMPAVASKPRVVQAAFKNGLLAGLLGKGLFAVVAPLFSRQLPTAANFVSTLRFALFMSLWSGGTRALLLLWRRIFGRHVVSSATAGAVAGLAVLVAEPADRRTMAFWVGLRGITTAVRALAHHGLIPTSRSPAVLVMMVISAFLMHSLLYNPGAQCGVWA